MEEAIARIRRFNRTLTQHIGALDEDFLDARRPLGASRLLYEIGEGAAIRALRGRLGLDSGYASRLLRQLEDERLVKTTSDAGDRRVRTVVLTAAGKREVARLNRRSDAHGERVLAALDEGERGALLGAMATIERLLLRDAVTIAVVAPGTSDARRCLEHYFAELGQRFETGFDPVRSLPADADELVPPHGAFLVARLRGEAVACGAVKFATGEIKRMWVAPSVRGLGIARRVLEQLEALARAAGVRVLRLETNQALVEARALYRRSGYREVKAFNTEPYAHHWFEKVLGSPSKASAPSSRSGARRRRERRT